MDTMYVVVATAPYDSGCKVIGVTSDKEIAQRLVNNFCPDDLYDQVEIQETKMHYPAPELENF